MLYLFVPCLCLRLCLRRLRRLRLCRRRRRRRRRLLLLLRLLLFLLPLLVLPLFYCPIWFLNAYCKLCLLRSTPPSSSAAARSDGCRWTSFWSSALTPPPPPLPLFWSMGGKRTKLSSFWLCLGVIMMIMITTFILRGRGPRAWGHKTDYHMGKGEGRFGV